MRLENVHNGIDLTDIRLLMLSQSHPQHQIQSSELDGMNTPGQDEGVFVVLLVLYETIREI